MAQKPLGSICPRPTCIPAAIPLWYSKACYYKTLKYTFYPRPHPPSCLPAFNGSEKKGSPSATCHGIAPHMIVQYVGSKPVTAVVTACTVPNPTSFASAALCSFASTSLKIRWFISPCVISFSLFLHPSLNGTLSSSTQR